MEATIETTEGLQRKLKVAIPTDQIDTAVSKKLEDLSGSVNLSGFRKGKVPMRVLKQKYGKGVRQEVLGDLMKETLYQALKEKSIEPAAVPTIDSIQDEAGKPVEYIASFEVFPEIKLVDLTAAEVETIKSELNDADIDKTIEQLRTQRKVWANVERACKMGDQTTIDFEGTINAQPFEGNASEDFKLELGSNSMIPGFEDEIVGMAIGEERNIAVTFPKDYHSKDIAAKPAIFKIKLKQVEESSLPDVDDAFAQSFDIEDGIDALREEISSNMRRELEQALKQRNKATIFDKFIELNDVELPKSMVDQEILNLQNDMVKRITGGKNIDLGQFPEMPRDIFEEQAKRRVKLSLLVTEFVKVNKLKVNHERVEAMIEDIAKSFEQPESVHAWYKADKSRIGQIELAALEEQVCEKLIEQAKLVEKSMTFEEIMNPKTDDQTKED